MSKKILFSKYQWKPFNYLNISYNIILIISSSFKDLRFFLLSIIISIGNIEKTIILVDNIKKDKVFRIYLETFLLDSLKNKGDNEIRAFLSILKAKIKTISKKKFFIIMTKIICIDITKIRVDIPNIKYIIL